MIEIKKDFNLNIIEMKENGLHIGHQKSRFHPKMKEYIQNEKNNIHLINLNKTIEKFNEALNFIEELAIQNKNLLFVGTKIQIREIVKAISQECGLPYVNQRWIGGTLSNFEIIKKRIEYFKDLERKRDIGELEKYTKKEQNKINQELKKLEMKFGGIKNLEKLPDAVFICDMKKNNLAAKEARKKGIKIIGICDTNVDPSLADFFIPGNDDAINSVKYILEKVKEVILKGKENLKINV